MDSDVSTSGRKDDPWIVSRRKIRPLYLIVSEGVISFERDDVNYGEKMSMNIRWYLFKGFI
ncbi:uncharacterized protein MELLADRAFT_74111 [Melampsora larici-populina 98AG31]|uniref:Uncharacterized protein n=1 Tax=Melampsora larici-populina (strain 98AG31 / pathotype 3-4-7) TaxID=747676 RepID=F4R936_MELLP|nr:uncharacterized protein MELLADRAFT_74111 [Melampsora larici-populina 98AG31]EGG11223.1 hypothetical protein MELLADRAFT_74111 [Melampsora larici-populina 98AG31]